METPAIWPELLELLQLLVSAALILVLVMIPVLMLFGFFGAFFCGVVLVCSNVGGWRALAAAYPAQATPEGQRFRWQWMKFGRSVVYKGGVNITVTADGLHLTVILPYRVGHDPISIPWRDIHAEPGGKHRFREVIALKFDKEPNVTVYMLPGPFERIAEASRGQLGLAATGTYSMAAMARPRSI